MIWLKKIFIVFLIGCTSLFLFPRMNAVFASEDITVHEPVLKKTGESSIPDKPKPEEKKSGISKWIYIGLGAAALAGLAAAAGGGGGGGGGDEGGSTGNTPETPPATNNNGNIQVAW